MQILNRVRATWKLRAFGFFKVPLLFFVNPSVVELTDDRCEVVIPLVRRTKNHWGSMYFGSLAVGADCAGGLFAMHHIEKAQPKYNTRQVSIIFKDFHADFLKRAEGGDVHFVCTEGEKVRNLVDQAIMTGERQTAGIEVLALVPKAFGSDPVARFRLGLSLKNKRQ